MDLDGQLMHRLYKNDFDVNEFEQEEEEQEEEDRIGDVVSSKDENGRKRSENPSTVFYFYI